MSSKPRSKRERLGLPRMSEPQAKALVALFIKAAKDELGLQFEGDGGVASRALELMEDAEVFTPMRATGETPRSCRI